MSQMKVILLDRVGKLGGFGDEANVKAGYARHYLLPRKKAMRATGSNREYFSARKQKLQESAEFRFSEAEKTAESVDNLNIDFVSQASELDQLYGSVNVRSVVEELKKRGFNVMSEQVQLQRPIKTLGVHEIKVRFHADLESSVSVNIVRNEAEIKPQLAAWKQGKLPLGVSVSSISEEKKAKVFAEPEAASAETKADTASAASEVEEAPEAQEAPEAHEAQEAPEKAQ